MGNAACFATGLVLAVVASLGAQALTAESTPRTAAAAAAAPEPAASPVVPAATIADDNAVLEPETLPASRYAVVEVGGEPGAKIGRFVFTRYWVADETRSAAASDGDSVTIYDDRACKEITSVSHAFARELDMEGTGRLRDGRTVNVSKSDCGCGRAPCYRAMTGDARWGIGARGEPLEPYRTVAVDPDVIRLGSHLYIPELDGLTMPGPAPSGGFVHDGCVVAIDVGGRIRGRQLDFFVGRNVYRKAFDARYHLEHVTVHRGDARCTSGPS